RDGGSGGGGGSGAGRQGRVRRGTRARGRDRERNGRRRRDTWRFIGGVVGRFIGSIVGEDGCPKRRLGLLRLGLQRGQRRALELGDVQGYGLVAHGAVAPRQRRRRHVDIGGIDRFAADQ